MSLIKKAQEKDAEAFDELIRPELPKMYRIAISILRNEEDVADAIQETVLKCWENLSNLRKEEYFRTWLIRILINECNSLLKKRKKIVFMDELPETFVNDSYETVEWKEMIAQLDEKYQLVMELFYVDGFSTKEIASMLPLTDMNVRSRLSRGRKQLRTFLDLSDTRKSRQRKSEESGPQKNRKADRRNEHENSAIL